MAYLPSDEILAKYADVLVNFALGNGKGIKPGDVVWLRIHECSKPFYAPLRNAILKAGGHPLIDYMADGVDKASEYSLANPDQLAFSYTDYFKGLVEQADHMLYIIAEADKHELEEVEPSRIITRENARREYLKWRNAKEAAGKFSWTLAMYGTPSMAADANLSEEEYWQQIIKACYLDAADPIAEWKKAFSEIGRVVTSLNDLAIERLHLEGEDIDLWVGIGANRLWLGGGGQNIPSFEVFTSPDWRQTEGHIRFNQPLYRYGNVIEDIQLRFEKGEIVEATASKGEELLKELISIPGANRLGEYSLTDARLSHITKFMGETLYDENMGGEQGNTHMAVGVSFDETYRGDSASMTDEQLEELGFNQSREHVDIVSTTRRTVTAILQDGSEKVIYKDGQFTL